MQHQIEFLVGLLLAVALLAAFARRVGVAESVLLFVVGVGLGLVPGAPQVVVPPDVIFLVFLPPLVYYAAFVSSPRELRAQARPIGMLAIALVFATTAGIAAVAHELIPGMPWAPAFALGAILAPTDPVAATSVIRAVGAPRRLVTLLEGEALVNDGIGLTANRVAVSAAVAGSFSVGATAGRFVLVALGGVAIGLAIGWLVAKVRPRFNDPDVEITLSLFTPYLAYLPAEAAGLSGILAAVATGLYMSWQSPGLFRPGTRLQANAFWGVFNFVLNSVLFLLLGLQFRQIVDGIGNASAGRLAVYAAAVAGTAIAIRLLWQFTVPHLTRALSRRLRAEPATPWRERLVVGWSGMRGAVSLAAALAIPLETDAGHPFPFRNLIIFLTFCVIFATLALQGVTLPGLLRLLGLRAGEGEQRRETHARLRVAHAALARMEEIQSERDGLPEHAFDTLRALYEARVQRLQADVEEGDERPEELEQRTRAFRALVREVLGAERRALLELRD
ncbi:MAG TPA: Na+/H+ antiporter, partial [Longimicrobiales bacterium]|nr:Na+/H+ antiporter [Longimicrobiales bacterium]